MMALACGRRWSSTWDAVRVILVVAGLVVVVSCRHDTASLLIDLPEGAPAPAPAELSRFSVPLTYDFTPILRVVERVVPQTFGSIDSVRQVGDDSHRHYAFEANRAPFTVFADGGVLHLRTTLSYRARAFYKPMIGPTLSAGCGGGKADDRPRIIVELATPMTLTADWHLSSQAKLVRVEPASDDQRDHCDVTIIHHDVTGRVVEAARGGITGHLKDIDKKIAAVDLRERFANWWTLLARPIRLTDGVWLLLHPEGLGIGRVDGRGHSLDIPVTLAARPQIVASAIEPPLDSVRLPPLARDSSIGGFHVVIDGLIDYGSATEMLNRALVDRQVTQAGRTVSVTHAGASPASKGRLALAVTFTGDAKGTLRFVGTPEYDARRRQIAVPDLDYDLATDDQLINAFAWLRSDAMRGTFRDRARFSVDSALGRGRGLLLEGLNRTIGNVVTLKATVDSVGVRGLYVTRPGIVVRAVATGHVAVTIRQQP